MQKVLSGMDDQAVKEADVVLWKKFDQLLGLLGSGQDTFEVFYAFLEKNVRADRRRGLQGRGCHEVHPFVYGGRWWCG
jgi:hypothetical protein